jgi:hypothetical protein
MFFLQLIMNENLVNVRLNWWVNKIESQSSIFWVYQEYSK